MKTACTTLLALALISSPAIAGADTFYTYTYTGAPFLSLFSTPPVYDVRIDFTLTSPFYVVFADPNAGASASVTPIAYSFSDGHQVLTEANSTASFSLQNPGPNVIPDQTVPSAGIGTLLRAQGKNGHISMDRDTNFGGFGLNERGLCCASAGSNIAGFREGGGTWQVSVSDSPIGVPEPPLPALLVLG
jgi:hypothetical protein